MTNPFQRMLGAWFAIAIVIMLGVAAVAYAAYTKTIAQDAWVVHTRDVMDLLSKTAIAERDMQSGARGYVITGDSAFLEPYSVGKANIDALLDKLDHSISDNPVQVETAKQLRARLLERATFTANLLARYEKDGFDHARRFIAGGYGMEVSRQIRSLLSQMQAEEERLLIERNQQVADGRGLALAIGAGGLLLSIIIIGLVFALVRRESTRRLSVEAELSGTNQKLSGSLQLAERLIQEKHMIDRVAGLLHSCNSIEDAREIIGKEIRQALPDLRGAMYLFRASRNLVEVISHWNEPNALVSAKSFPPEECWALKSGRPHIMRSPDDVSCGHIDVRVTEAAVCVPMNSHGEAIGVMVVEGSTEQLDEARLDLIFRLVDQIGMSLATLRLQQQLRDQSFRDPLTGLFNRRYLEATIEKDVSRADRYRHSIGLVEIDIDHFKSINDRYGHDAGDLVLKNTSDTLRRHARTEDIACRYGGEEFLLVLSGASQNTTCERAETVRLAVEKQVATLANGTSVTGTTISLGIAMYPTHGETWQAAVGVADQALYRAKDQGRNRVVVADPVLGAAAMET